MTVKGPHGEFETSPVEFDRLYKGRDGYKLVADPNAPAAPADKPKGGQS